MEFAAGPPSPMVEPPQEEPDERQETILGREVCE